MSVMFSNKANYKMIYKFPIAYYSACESGSGKNPSDPGAGEKSCGSSSNDNNSSTPNIYDSRKYGHNLPCNSIAPSFGTLPNIPTGVFRCTVCEVIGRGASKNGYYKNPEYFSYHHMSYYDFHWALRAYRQPNPKTGRKM